jgi:hypothetical protein
VIYVHRRRPLSERWYDVQSGSITIGAGGAAASSSDSQPSQSPSHDLRALNLRWWRRSVGLVQQEPALFGVSLRDNIALGCERRPTDAEIEAAAKAANAYDFIARMPQVRARVREHGVNQHILYSVMIVCLYLRFSSAPSYRVLVLLFSSFSALTTRKPQLHVCLFIVFSAFDVSSCVFSMPFHSFA